MAEQLVEIVLTEHIDTEDGELVGGLHWSPTLDIPDGATIIFKNGKPYIRWETSDSKD